MKLLRIAAFAILISSFSACAWIKSHPNTVAAIESSAFKIGVQIAQAALSNGTIDYAHTVPAALNSVSDIVAGLSADKAKPVIANAVNTFSAYSIPADQVTKIADFYAAFDPETPAVRKAVLIGMAGDLSAGITKTAAAAK